MVRLAERASDYDDQERAQTVACYCAEYPTLIQEFHAFSEGQPGHRYTVEYGKFHYALHSIQDLLTHGQEPLEVLVPRSLQRARAAIDAIPIPSNTAILEAGTPFTTYSRLRSLCEVEATTELVWVDPYVAPNIFYRYLRAVRPDVAVTLVTATPRATASRRDQDNWAAFLDVSRLYAQERGPDHYRLVVHGNLLHDRWLVFDQKRFYSLGGSAKDAGRKQYFTISVVEDSPQNLKRVRDHTHHGTELFGPSNTTHG